MKRLGAFLLAVIRHWKTLLTGALFSIGLMVWDYAFQREITPRLFLAIIVITLLAACFYCWRDEHDQVERITKHANEAVEELSKLRAEAITFLLNMPLSKGDDVSLLTRKQDEWRDRVVAVLRANKVSEPIVRSFLYLGVLRGLPFGHAINPAHDHRLQILARQLEVVEGLIGQYSSLLQRDAG